jgi:actin-related protein
MFNSELGVLVADIGSCNCRIGFAGDDTPKAQIPSVVGGIVENNQSPKFFDKDLFNYQENMELSHPVQDGVIVDWDSYESLWHYTADNVLKVDLKEAPILISEKPYNPPSNRKTSCQLMFETFDVPGLFVSKDSVLSCYANGRTTGISIDCGGSGTTISPVIEGFAEPSTLNRSMTGGRYTDAYAMNLIRNIKSEFEYPLPSFRIEKTDVNSMNPTVKKKALNNVHPTYDAFMNLEMGRHMKESISRVSDTILADMENKLANIPLNQYELPDGTLADVGVERFICPELIFDPSSYTFESVDLANLYATEKSAAAAAIAAAGSGTNLWKFNVTSSNESVPKLVNDSIFRCENDLQSSMFANLVVHGGAAAFPNFSERMRNDVELLVRSHAPTVRVKQVSGNYAGRHLSTWLGGSILGAISDDTFFISKQDYLEYGSSIVERKCV